MKTLHCIPLVKRSAALPVKFLSGGSVDGVDFQRVPLQYSICIFVPLCVNLGEIALRYSVSAPLTRLVAPRFGCHNIQRLTTFYSTENPLRCPNGVILFASSRYLLITRILGYFWDIKLKSVAVGKILQNYHKNHSTPRFLAVNQNHTFKAMVPAARHGL